MCTKLITMWDLCEIENVLIIQWGLEYKSRRNWCLAALPQKCLHFPGVWRNWTKICQYTGHLILHQSERKRERGGCMEVIVFFMKPLVCFLLFILTKLFAWSKSDCIYKCAVRGTVFPQTLRSHLQEMWVHVGLPALQCNTYHWS